MILTYRKRFLIPLILMILNQSVFAQYTLNGSATQDACNAYTLTPASTTKSGSVWNNNKINLNQSFDFNFDVYLGDPQANGAGADGIAFVLQPISTSVGSTGGGLGYEGISPAIGVTIDTYQNAGDPTFDHIAIQLNGDINHNTANNIAGPVQAINGNDDIEDSKWHSMRIVWDATTTTLSIYIDGSLRVNAVRDFVNTVFGGNPLVFWGFTGSTGGEFNKQGFKIALNPAFNFNATQTRCLGDAVTFNNNTISFTPLAKFYWDFGDNSPLDSVTTNPVHTYNVYGDLTASLRVIGADGCTATFGMPVRIGTKPVAVIKATQNASNSCNFNTPFFDSSYLTFGTINNWYWDNDDGFTNTVQNPTVNYINYGYKNIKLAVSTAEGCKSDTMLTTITKRKVFPDLEFTDSVCLSSPTFFTGKTTILPDGAVMYAWIINGILVSNQSTFSYTFQTPGIHSVQLNSGLSGSCVLPKMVDVFVADKPHAGIKKNIFCPSVSNTLTDSSYTTDGIPITDYWWDLGNGQFSTQKDPVVTYTTGPITVRHVVTNAKGCTSDTLTQIINLAAKPVANFGYSTPVCTGLPVQFSDSSKAAGGTIIKWSWIYNNAVFSSIQNSSNTFTPGQQTVKLVATSNTGCISDTITKTFFVNPNPDVTINFKDACKFAEVNFTATDNSATVTKWQWSFGDGSGIANTQNTKHTYVANGTYKVKLIAAAANGCFSNTLEKDINIYGTNAFAGNDTIAAAGQPVQLNATGGLSYSWTPATPLNNPGIANPVAILNATQTFIVRAFTPEGCESFDDVTVNIYKGPDIYLPTAFTPNGDGRNDLFRGTPVGIKQFNYLRVFNRWGQLIFATSDYNRGWDGTWKGQQQPTGVYVITANGIDFRGNEIDKRQTVMLIR